MVMYDSYEDLLNKVDYYLSHDKEREEIALAGQRNVLENHTLSQRLDEMEKVAEI